MAQIDFYRFDEKLTPEEKILRDTIRSFVGDTTVRALIHQCNIDASPVPRQLIETMAKLGVFGANIPDENGERLSNVGYGVLMRELEACDSALRSFASVQSGLVMYPIWRFGSDEQKTKWLQLLREAKAIGCFGLTEEHGGSNPSAMTTKANLDGNEYVLNGSKIWITNAPSADVALVWAKTAEGIRGFLVERGTPGFTTNLIPNKASLRASETGELSLIDCRIPKENLLPGALGIKAVFSCLNKARYGIAWGCGGIVRTCYENVLEYVKLRAPFGKALAGMQLVQDDLANIDASLVKIQALCFQLAHLADLYDNDAIAEKELGDQISFAKWQCVELAIGAVDRALELAGANGLTYDFPFWAHFANLRTLRTYEGTKKIHLLAQGRRITDISAF